MSWFEAIVLGIVQGLTEFLPISSSGHLRIVPAFFGWEDPGAAFTAVTQLGTMAAVLVYFRHDLWGIGRGWLAGLVDAERRRSRESVLGWYIVLATIPIGLIGLTFADQIEGEARNLTLIGITLIGLGLLLFVADRSASQRRTADDLGWRDALVIGLAQAAALIPGVSRSGATITAGLFLGLGRADAARFSFLLSVPAVVLSGLFQLGEIDEGGGPGTSATVIATVLAFVSGYASIAFLLKFLVTNRLTVFVVYRVALGALVLALVAAGLID